MFPTKVGEINAVQNLVVRKRPRLLGMTTVTALRGLHKWPRTQELKLRDSEEAHKMCPINFSNNLMLEGTETF